MKAILDACCAINLYNGGAMDLVIAPGDVEWRVGPRVLEECDGHPCSKTLRAAIAEARLELSDDQTISAGLYLSLLAEHGLGEGETECLALAHVVPGLVVATDDRRARAVAGAVLGEARVTGSLGLLRRCVAATTWTPAQAFHSYTVMIEAGAFLPVIAESFFSV